MTDIDNIIRAGRRLSRDHARAANTVRSSVETLTAAGDVVSARLRILASAVSDPRKTDLVEMSLMSSEKVEALSRSAAAVSRAVGEIGGRLGAGAMAEAGLASRCAVAVAAAPSPAAAFAAQWSYGAGWWDRAADQLLALQSLVLKSQADALRPIARTAAANARRLRK